MNVHTCRDSYIAHSWCLCSYTRVRMCSPRSLAPQQKNIRPENKSYVGCALGTNQSGGVTVHALSNMRVAVLDAGLRLLVNTIIERRKIFKDI